MDHSTIAALIFAEQGADALDAGDERRRQALSAGMRRDAAWHRAARLTRFRELLAGALRRAAVAVEPRRPCAAVADAPG